MLVDSKSKLFNALMGTYAWEYGVLAIIYVIALSFLVVAKYETIELDKNVNL